MQYRIHRMVLIGIALAIPALELLGLFSVMRYIAPGLMAPRGDITRVAATYSLGLYLLVFTTSCLPAVPFFWIGTTDGSGLTSHCFSVSIVTILALLCSWWTTIAFFTIEYPPLPAELEGIVRWFLVFPVCLLCLLGWTLLRRPQSRSLPARAVGIILRLHYATCAFFVATTYFALRWATPLG